MNAKRVRQCLLAIASLTHGLKVASNGNETVNNLAANLDTLLLCAANDLEPWLAMDETDTQEMLPMEMDKRARS